MLPLRSGAGTARRRCCRLAISQALSTRPHDGGALGRQSRTAPRRPGFSPEGAPFSSATAARADTGPGPPIRPPRPLPIKPSVGTNQTVGGRGHGTAPPALAQWGMAL